MKRDKRDVCMDGLHRQTAARPWGRLAPKAFRSSDVARRSTIAVEARVERSFRTRLRERFSGPVAVFLVAALAVVHASAAGVSWRPLSSTTGELPAPNAGGEQTCCVVADFDRDGRLDILMRPYHHNAPRLDVLLNGP